MFIFGICTKFDRFWPINYPTRPGLHSFLGNIELISLPSIVHIHMIKVGLKLVGEKSVNKKNINCLFSL